MNRQKPMDCSQVQHHLDDLARNRLADPQAILVRHHLADCTDCRVLQQRGARLQRLLALKNYEQPAPAYFDNFLTRFHQRLAAEEARPTFWQRFFSFGDAELLGSWRVGLAGACGLALCAGLLWIGLRNTNEAIMSATPITVLSPVVFTDPAENEPQLRLSDFPRQNSGELLAIDTVAAAPAPLPRYVLDRIAITPASYDVTRADF